MICEDCNRVCEMVWPDEEDPRRKFKCSNCNTVYVGVEIITDEDLKVN